MRGLYLFLAIILTSLSANGQLLLGPKIGAHIGQVQFERQAYQDQYDANLKPGFSLGGGITFPVINPFSLHSELMLSSKGKSLNIPLESLKNVAEYYYLEMPIMMRYEILPQQGFYLGIGPNLSYWLTGSGKLSNIEPSTTSNRYKINFNDAGDPDRLNISDANRLQLGLLVGAGVLLDTRDDGKFMLEFRYEMGHSYLGNAQGAAIESLEFSDNLESKHRTISLSMGYFWAFHQKSAKKKSHTFKAKQRKD